MTQEPASSSFNFANFSGSHKTTFPLWLAEAETPTPPEPEVLYVRKGEGRGARYALAGAGEVGQRFRRRMVGRRASYEVA